MHTQKNPIIRMSLKSLKYFHNLYSIDNSLDQNLIEKLDLKRLEKAKNKLGQNLNI
jgi:hypothetical protein